MARFWTRKTLRSILLLVSLIAVADVCLAHPGPVGSDGCHLDGSGRRHCH